MHDRLKAISLFSGIGGLDLAAEAAVIEPVLFCEIEPYACEILKKRWPDVPICNDIRTLSGSGFAGTIDIIYGGFPCQDLSCAGKQAGLSGDRSGLWFEMLRVVREVRPRWVVAENVRGAVNLALDTVCAGLEDEGYVVWPFVLPAAAFGAPHRRERLAVVAARGDVADAVTERLEGCERSEALCEPRPSAHEPVAECGARLWPTPRGSDGTHGGPNQRGSRGDLMLSSAVAMWPTPRANDSEKRGCIGDDQRNGLPSAVLWPTPHRNCSNGAGEHGDGGRNIQTAVNGTLNPDWVECLQGFPIGWTDIDCDEPQPWPGWPAGMGERDSDDRSSKLWATPQAHDAIGGDPKRVGRYGTKAGGRNLSDEGLIAGFDQYPYEPPRTCGKIPNRAKRLKCLGNAVVPQQFAAFFEAIREMSPWQP